ncbi:MAG: hypothetical protein KC438_14395, partial [Thermomicrobiales bacterium]|nr:hypothetical protein [Thermomicrobiales bacterium]
MTQERSSRIDGNPIETSARLAMLRDVEDLSRRRLLQMGGAFASAAAMFAAGVPLVGVNAQSDDATPTTELPDVTDFPENLKGEGEVVVASWGGTFQAAQREAYFEPFQELSGITVIEAEGPSIAQVQAMVDTGNIEWDVVQLDRASVMNLEQKGDYWEPIDYSLFDTDNIDEERRYTFSVDMLPYAQIIGYRTDEFPEGPGSWADFWDVDAFPGPRTMIGGGGLWPYLEAALMAEGVAKEDLYPIDIDRAYASLDNIRGDVVRWW